jgi:drug/metabolite transporter (DMT)-like permease
VSDWLVSIAGTPEGARLATLLALMSAVAHAAFGALQKGRHDPWITRASIDLWILIFSAPVALFVVPWPQGWEWAILGGAIVIHFAYKLTMALAYSRAAYTVVYPVVRGTGPLVTVAFAAIVFHEFFAPLQWLGVAILSGGILALSALNLQGEKINRAALKAGLAWALAGGLLVALYTTYDAWGIRTTADPFTFLAWFFFVTALDFPVMMARRLAARTRAPDGRALMLRGAVGALIAFISFGGVMLATRIGRVGEAAVLRETSTVFAALIGWLILGETVGWRRGALMALIAGGAILVQVGR